MSAPSKLAAVPVQFAAAAETLVKASPAVLKQPLLEAAPMPLFKPAKVTKLETRPAKPVASRYVVQIGAYRHIIQAERAWGEAQRRYDLGAKQALSTTVTLPGRGTFHRLSLAPFQNPEDAGRVCGTIRARGGTCFVRTMAGDIPLQYAARNARRG
jgi:cell division protein FtsN